MSRSPLVVITDHPWATVDIELEVLAETGARVVDADGASPAELRSITRGADAILTCFADISAAMIDEATNLRVIGRSGTGVDNIDVKAAAKRGIPVTNVPTYCVDEVAEHVLALTLTSLRRITAYDRAVRAGDWALDTGAGIRRIAGSTFGVLGYGQIGAAVAARARALGFRVVVCTSDSGAHRVAASGLERVDLEGLARRSDVVSLHLPLGPATREIVDASFISEMKRGAVLINAARGGLVDQMHLARALRERRIGGAALDVFAPERLEPGHPLLDAPNTVLTPHVAFSSEESMRALARLAAENVAAVLSGRTPASIVGVAADPE